MRRIALSKNIEYPKLGLTFQLDTNRINTRGNETATTELEKWAELGVIELEWSRSVYDELSQDAPNGRNWRKANKRLVAHASITAPEEHQKLREIENIVFPGGVLNQNEKNDLFALFTAWKYLTIFVTLDGLSGKPRKILTKQMALKRIGVNVMSDTEALAFMHDHLSKKANKERLLSNSLGQSEPAWISKCDSFIAHKR